MSVCPFFREIPDSLEKVCVLNYGRWAHINVKLHFELLLQSERWQR